LNCANGATSRLDITFAINGRQIAPPSKMLWRQYRREIRISVSSRIALPARTSALV
jgi:hypothetical protein